MLERHEENIEDWYFNHQKDAALEDFLCRDFVLDPSDRGNLRTLIALKPSHRPCIFFRSTKLCWCTLEVASNELLFLCGSTQIGSGLLTLLMFLHSHRHLNSF